MGHQFSPGDLFSQRNFYNPEFDANLTNYVGWTRKAPGFSLIAPDEFKFHFAWWGFYDGMFDYLSPQWRDALRAVPRSRQSSSDQGPLLSNQGGVSGSRANMPVSATAPAAAAKPPAPAAAPSLAASRTTETANYEVSKLTPEYPAWMESAIAGDRLPGQERRFATVAARR